MGGEHWDSTDVTILSGVLGVAFGKSASSLDPALDRRELGTRRKTQRQARNFLIGHRPIQPVLLSTASSGHRCARHPGSEQSIKLY